MSEQSTEIAKAALRQATPWRPGMAWWVVVLEGLIGLGIGLYILMNPNAGERVVLLLAAYLLLISVERVINGFSAQIPPVILAERMLRAGIGLTVGLIIVLNTWQNFMSPSAALVILSLGWLLIGAVGLWEWFSASGELGLGYGALIFPVISTLFGLLMLVSRLSLGGILLQLLGIVAVVAGVALLGYGYWLYRKASTGLAIAA